MLNLIKQSLSEDHSRGLLKYTLLLACVALASAALFLGASHSIKGI
jgi:hypothetical protein